MVDPGTMMMLASLATSALGSATGEKGQMGSTYNKGQRREMKDILSDIQGMKGGAMDVTKNQGYGQGMDWLMSMFNDPQFFDKFEAPLQRQFEEQTIPDLANRFASMGSGGAMGSTGFRNQLAREGSNLSTNIAALRGGMQQNAIPQLQSYAQQPFENLMKLYGFAMNPTQNTYQGPSAGVGSLSAPFASGAAQYFTNRGGGGGGDGRASLGPMYDDFFRQTGLPM